MNSFELLFALKKLGYDKAQDPWWWPDSGSFSVVVGAILTQNTNWQRVEISLANLRAKGVLSLEALANYPLNSLEVLIRPSGFYTSKATNIQRLAQRVLENFGDFENFCKDVDREWLLEQRGIGFETADSILNYACYKESFVVDSYSARVLRALGYELSSYEELQEWFIEGIRAKEDRLFGFGVAQTYARSHGMIVEYCKANKRGRAILVDELLYLLS